MAKPCTVIWRKYFSARCRGTEVRVIFFGFVSSWYFQWPQWWAVILGVISLDPCIKRHHRIGPSWFFFAKIPYDYFICEEYLSHECSNTGQQVWPCLRVGIMPEIILVDWSAMENFWERLQHCMDIHRRFLTYISFRV